MSFIRIYLRVLGLLHTETRLAVTLALANIVLAGAQFVEPVLFGRIIDALSGALPAGLAPAAHALAPPVAVGAALGLLRALYYCRPRPGRLVPRPHGAPPPQPGDRGFLRARSAAAARLPFRRAFRPADEDHAHRHRYAVVAVVAVLPRALRRLRFHFRAVAGDGHAELAAGD